LVAVVVDAGLTVVNTGADDVVVDTSGFAVCAPVVEGAGVVDDVLQPITVAEHINRVTMIIISVFIFTPFYWLAHYFSQIH